MANLKSWKKALNNAIYDSWSSDMDTDHPECPRCESIMNFYGHDDSGDFPIGEGYWECDNCGFKITEREL